VQDDEQQVKIAGKLFKASDHREIILVVLSSVVAETIFVLESFYNQPCHTIARALGRLLESPGIEVIDADIHQAALIEYGKGKHHFVDCLIASFARTHNWSVASFDQGFRKLPDIA